MTYNRQQFNAGTALPSQKLNQLEENIDQVRTSHIGTLEPAELTEGIIWIDTTTDPFVAKIYTGTNWLEFLKINEGEAIAWGLEGEFVTDANNPVINSTAFSVTASITQSIWESVGPTGSGADNIWTALDDIKKQAHWIEIRSFINTGDTAGPTSETKVWTRRGGSSLGAIDTTLSSYVGIDIPTTSNTRRGTMNQVVIPVDESNIFDCRWERLSGNTSTITFSLVGYGFNR